MDSANARCVALPVCAPKVAVQQYLQQQVVATAGSFSYTAIAKGLFLNWGLRMDLLVDLVHHTATLYNGGDVLFSATNLADVATAVGVIRHQPETANRIVYIRSALVTQRQLISYAVEIDGKPWTTTTKDTEELRQENLVELAKGPEADVNGAMLGFCSCLLHTRVVSSCDACRKSRVACDASKCGHRPGRVRWRGSWMPAALHGCVLIGNSCVSGSEPSG